MTYYRIFGAISCLDKPRYIGKALPLISQGGISDYHSNEKSGCAREELPAVFKTPCRIDRKPLSFPLLFFLDFNEKWRSRSGRRENVRAQGAGRAILWERRSMNDYVACSRSVEPAEAVQTRADNGWFHGYPSCNSEGITAGPTRTTRAKLEEPYRLGSLFDDSPYMAMIPDIGYCGGMQIFSSTVTDSPGAPDRRSKKRMRGICLVGDCIGMMEGVSWHRAARAPNMKGRYASRGL